MPSAAESDAGGTPHRARRSPTAAELHAWRLFIETSEALRYVVEAGLQADAGLSSADYAVMVALSDEPTGRLRSSQLADRINWQRSRLSHHLGRMERRGLVARVSVDDDSRGAQVTLTAEGAASYRAAFAPHMHTITETFVAGLDAEQIEAVTRAMEALRAHLDAGNN